MLLPGVGLKIFELFIDPWEIVADAEAFSAGASSVVFIDRRIDGSAEARRQQVMRQIDVCDCSLHGCLHWFAAVYDKNAAELESLKDPSRWPPSNQARIRQHCIMFHSCVFWCFDFLLLFAGLDARNRKNEKSHSIWDDEETLESLVESTIM